MGVEPSTPGVQPHELRARLERVRLSTVQVKMREKEVVAGVEDSGLWPRVTLSLDSQTAVVSLTGYATAKKKEDDDKKLSALGVVILRLCGMESRAMRTVHRNAALKWAFKKAEARIRARINTAIRQARTTNKLLARIEGAQRRKRRETAVSKLEDTFRGLLRQTVKLKDLSGAEIARIWERAKLEKVVEDVHDL